SPQVGDRGDVHRIRARRVRPPRLIDEVGRVRDGEAVRAGGLRVEQPRQVPVWTGTELHHAREGSRRVGAIQTELREAQAVVSEREVRAHVDGVPVPTLGRLVVAQVEIGFGAQVAAGEVVAGQVGRAEDV